MQDRPEPKVRTDKPDIPTTIDCMMNMSETIIVFNGDLYYKEKASQLSLFPLAHNN